MTKINTDGIPTIIPSVASAIERALRNHSESLSERFAEVDDCYGTVDDPQPILVQTRAFRPNSVTILTPRDSVSPEITSDLAVEIRCWDGVIEVNTAEERINREQLAEGALAMTITYEGRPVRLYHRLMEAVAHYTNRGVEVNITRGL